VLEVAPQYWQTPQGLKDIYLRTSSHATCRSAHRNSASSTTRCPSTTTACFRRDGVVQSGSGSFLGDATQRVAVMQQKLGTPSTIRGFFAGTLLAYHNR